MPQSPAVHAKRGALYRNDVTFGDVDNVVATDTLGLNYFHFVHEVLIFLVQFREICFQVGCQDDVILGGEDCGGEAPRGQSRGGAVHVEGFEQDIVELDTFEHAYVFLANPRSRWPACSPIPAKIWICGAC